MFKEKLEKIKNIFTRKAEGNNKKNIENLVFFLILLIITIIAINTIWGGTKKESKEPVNTTYKELAENTNISNNVNPNEYNLEDELEKILSNISGVGQVNVLVTYSETSEFIPIFNESATTSNTEETDTNGGKRTITESNSSKEVVTIDESGSKTLITSKSVMPKVEGAIIIAEGAKNINIKTDIIKAVSAVTGLPEHKVQVFSMK